MNLSLAFLDRVASETGYAQASLEKVSRLGEMAGGIARHPFLKESLALKGGTALNLCYGAPRRLSVDLDYNYIGTAEREMMLTHRPEIERAVATLAERYGYRVQASADAFAGRKFYLTYRSAFGQDERIEVDLNFLFRVPMNGDQMLPLWQPGGLDRPVVRTVSSEELLVGKLLAFFERKAPRDVWDICNLPESMDKAFATAMFRSLLIAFSITLEHPFSSYNQPRPGRGFDDEMISRHLTPLLLTGSSAQPGLLLERARNKVAVFFTLKDNEAQYCSLVEKGELRLELLFPDNPDMVSRIAGHPALLWKISNILIRMKKS